MLPGRPTGVCRPVRQQLLVYRIADIQIPPNRDADLLLDDLHCLHHDLGRTAVCVRYLDA